MTARYDLKIVHRGAYLTWRCSLLPLQAPFLHACWKCLGEAPFRAPGTCLRGIVFSQPPVCVRSPPPFVGVPPSGSWSGCGGERLQRRFHPSLLQAYACTDSEIAYVVGRAVIPPVLFLIGPGFS